MLEYTLTAEDLAAFAAWQATQSGEADARNRRMRLVGAWLAGGVAYLVVFAVSTMPLLLNLQLGLAGAMEVLDVLVGLAVGVWEWRRGRVGAWLARRRDLFRARVALERTGASRRVWLDEDGLNVTAGDRSIHVDWSEVSRVVETDDHVFVYTGQNAAHVVPRRAGAAADALVATLRERTGA